MDLSFPSSSTGLKEHEDRHGGDKGELIPVAEIGLLRQAVRHAAGRLFARRNYLGRIDIPWSRDFDRSWNGL